MGILDRLTGGGKTHEEKFWEWFRQHSSELAEVSTAREQICDELMAQMRRVHKNLTFTFGPTVDGRREFIVSADGIRAAFPAVKQLVAAAPDLPGWTIIAFRPPVDIGNITIGGLELGPDDIWFSSQIAGDKVGVVLYIRDLSQETYKPLAQGAFILLDHTLGEYTVETKLGALDFQPLPLDPVAMRLKPFRELPEVVGYATP